MFAVWGFVFAVIVVVWFYLSFSNVYVVFLEVFFFFLLYGEYSDPRAV